jgi:hypothetical protein
VFKRLRQLVRHARNPIARHDRLSVEEREEGDRVLAHRWERIKQQGETKR